MQIKTTFSHLHQHQTVIFCVSRNIYFYFVLLHGICVFIALDNGAEGPYQSTYISVLINFESTDVHTTWLLSFFQKIWIFENV